MDRAELEELREYLKKPMPQASDKSVYETIAERLKNADKVRPEDVRTLAIEGVIMMAQGAKLGMKDDEVVKKMNALISEYKNKLPESIN